jgi:hypothetical protein
MALHLLAGDHAVHWIRITQSCLPSLAALLVCSLRGCTGSWRPSPSGRCSATSDTSGFKSRAASPVAVTPSIPSSEDEQMTSTTVPPAREAGPPSPIQDAARHLGIPQLSNAYFDRDLGVWRSSSGYRKPIANLSHAIENRSLIKIGNCEMIPTNSNPGQAESRPCGRRRSQTIDDTQGKSK